jgi:glycogen synthase
MIAQNYNSLHVLMTADAIGGVWTYSLELIKAMAPYNVKFTLVTMGAKCSESQKADVSKIINLELIETNFKLEWMEDPWHDVETSGEWLMELEKQVKPDVMHLNGYAHAALQFKAPKIVVGHSCIYSWFDAVKDQAAPKTYEEYFKRIKKGLANADFVVAPSCHMMEYLNKYYGTFKSQAVVPNALETSSFFSAEKCNFIFSMGRLWDEAKNIKILESVSKMLSWPTLIAGEKKEPDGSKEMIIQNSKACFMGLLSKEEISKNLSKASIFVLPAKYEPFGLSVLEAALSGCALVLGDIPSLRENWDGAAVFVSPDNAKELKDVLEALISDPHQRAQMAEKARSRAAIFTVSKMAASYYAIYQNLISSSLVIEPNISTKHANYSVLP